MGQGLSSSLDPDKKKVQRSPILIKKRILSSAGKISIMYNYLGSYRARQSFLLRDVPLYVKTQESCAPHLDFFQAEHLPITHKFLLLAFYWPFCFFFFFSFLLPSVLVSYAWFKPKAHLFWGFLPVPSVIYLSGEFETLLLQPACVYTC